MSNPVDETNHVEISTYIGPRKPTMTPFPEYEVDDAFLGMQKVSRARAQDMDLQITLHKAEATEHRVCRSLQQQELDNALLECCEIVIW